MKFEELKNLGIINQLETLSKDNRRYESYEVNNENYCIILKYEKDDILYNYVVEYIEGIYINDVFDRFNFIVCMDTIKEYESKDMNCIHVYKRIENNS